MERIKSLAIIILMTTIIMILSIKVEATEGIINSETVRVRSEATTKSNILAQLDKNEKIEILEQSEGWYKVTFTKSGEKITGYISEKLVDIKDENSEEGKTTESNKKEEEQQTIETSANVEEQNKEPEKEENKIDNISTKIEESKEYTLNQKITINILPVINSIKVAQVEGGNIKIIEIINDWCKIENGTETGWIRNNILKRAINTSENVATPETEINNNTENSNENTEIEKEPTTTSEEKVIKTAYVSTESLKVRKEANTSSDVIDSLKKNDEV